MAPNEALDSTNGGALTEEELTDFQALKRRLDSGNCFESLGLEIGAGEEAIKRAYYELSRKYHPDRFFRRELGENAELVEQVFSGINHAYNTLKEPELRVQHEKEVRRRLRRAGRRNPSNRLRNANQASRSAGASSRGSSGQSRARETAREAASRAGSSRSYTPRSTPTSRPSAPLRPAATTPTPQPDQLNEVRFNVSGARARRATPEPTPEAPVQETQPQAQRQNRRPAPAAIERFKKQIAARMARARRSYQTALEDIENENWIKAASSLYLAMQYDPKNPEYQRLHAEVQPKAAQTRASQYIALAENAESYRNMREAIANYERAVACDPPGGVAYFRLAQLQQVYESDTRSALQNYRQAVDREPDKVRYRMALADLYYELDLRRNANREYQKILEFDPKNAEAKAGLKKTR